MLALDQVATDIQKSHELLSQAAQSLRQSYCSKIAKKPQNISVCATDGGLLWHRMHGVDIYLVRAAGVHFRYENSCLKSHDYHPKKSPDSIIEIRNHLDDHEARVFGSLIRLKSELSCAIELIEKYDPYMLLLDGSVLPLPSDVPRKESAVYPLYLEVCALYKKLFSFGREKLVCGVIKDSRSASFAKSVGLNCSDSVLCSYLLSEGERTSIMPYSGEVQCFYLKAAENDLPLRVEVVGNKAEQAAEILYSISAISENFGYPAVLVEADMCAALDPREMEPIKIMLGKKAKVLPLRRNARPFRSG